MQIRFSRHARRRARHYKIAESIIRDILKDIELSHGRHEIMKGVKGFRYKLKIIVSVENDIMTVITNYPLKKGKEK